MSGESGIYIHLPYCRSRCGYCSFVVSTDDSSRPSYFAALDREIVLVAAEAAGHHFDSIYLGGGTPSLLPVRDLAGLLKVLRERLAIAASAEVTLEANPDDVSAEGLRGWVDSGVTRVSLGVQSFQDRELAEVGRRHDASRARKALEILTGAGLSVSGDLILGLPGQTAATFRASVSILGGSGVDHISIYLLEVDKSKSIEEDRRLRPQRYLSDDAQADLWLELSETLGRKEFRHYEISNWAVPGREARHNLKYWKRLPTLGLGVGAHEYWNGRRRANVSGLAPYIACLEEGRRPVALDRSIDSDEEAREEVVLGLRLAEGVPIERIERRVFGTRDGTLPEDYSRWRQEGLLQETGGRLRLTERGFLVSNEILCRFV